MSELTPLEPPIRMNRNVLDAIENAIVRGELTPESEMSDRRLAEMLHVSRTPVRDALLQLETNGLVERRGGMRWAVAGFDERDVHERYEVRRLLEPVGLERLAKTWDEQRVKPLSTLFDRFPASLTPADYDEYLIVDNQFHKGIVACSGNRQVIAFYAQLEKHINRIRYYLAPQSVGWIEDIAADHREICSAMATHDLEGARTALLRHLEVGEQRMIEFWRRRASEVTTEPPIIAQAGFN